MNYISHMNLIDIIICFIFLLASFKGFKKGLVIEAASFLSLFIGILGGMKFSNILAEYISSFSSWSPILIQVIAFIVVFAIFVRLTSLIANVITKVLKLALLGLINRIFGAFFGAIKWGVILSAFIFFFGNLNNGINLIPQKHIENSILYKPMLELGEKIYYWGTGISSNYLDKKIIESI